MVDENLNSLVMFAKNGFSEPFNMIDHPHAAYYNGKTYVVWHGEDLSIYITYYSHTTGIWESNTKIADNPLINDSHGAPSIVIDDDGYIYVFYGSHNSNQKYTKSNTPENIINGFTQQLGLDTSIKDFTYPQPIKVGGLIYLFFRNRMSGSEEFIIYNGASWIKDEGTQYNNDDIIIKPPNVGYPAMVYVGYLELNNNKIHVTWTYDYQDNPGETPLSRSSRRNIFYAYLNLENRHMYSINGTDLGTFIDGNIAENFAMVHNTGSLITNPPPLHVDKNGNPWIFYIEGSGTLFTFYHTRWTGSKWTTPVAITTTNRKFDFIDFLINSESDATAYLTTSAASAEDPSFFAGGDIEEWHWNGSLWSKVRTVLSESESGYPLNSPIVPFNYNPELKILFCQYLGTNFNDISLKLYAYIKKIETSISSTVIKYTVGSALLIGLFKLLKSK